MSASIIAACPDDPTPAAIKAALAILRSVPTGPDRWSGRLSNGDRIEIRRGESAPESFSSLGPDGGRITLTGRLTAITLRETRQGLPWITAILLSTLDGPLGVDVFPATWATLPPLPPSGTEVAVTGRVDRRGPAVRIAAETITTTAPGGAR